MAKQLSMFTSGSGDEDTLGQLVELAERILRDKPKLELSHLAGEILRASVGVGDWALPVARSRSVPEMLGPALRKRRC